MTAERLLILTFYYPPDLSAGSFRAASLVKALLASDDRVRIDVVTTCPNRYGSFTSDAPHDECAGRVRIRRIALPEHRSGMVDQARAFATYLRDAARMTRDVPYDLVYATSSRLMTAALGRWIARRTASPLYLDIRDLFVDTMDDVLSKPLARATNPVFAAVERWTIAGARHVNLVSRGFEPYVRRKYPRQSVSFFSNGVDEEFIAPKRRAPRPSGAPIRIVYAGNIGDGQGLHAIVPALAQRLDGRAVFRLIGDGGRRGRLELALERAGVANVEVVPPISRANLIDEYVAADVLFLHLNDYPAFKKVLPSKLFEYAALGKPIWAGVSGYAAEFVRAEIVNAAVFNPCDVAAAVAALEQLELRETPRHEFVERYARERIMRSMADHMLAVARNDD